MLLRNADSHLRRRLRAQKLKQWKRRRIMALNLIRLGASRSAWTQIYKGHRSLWALSHSSVADQTMNNQWFRQQKLISLTSEWQRLNPMPVTVAAQPLRLGLRSSGVKPLLSNGKPQYSGPKSRM